jgi:O-antigen/teichoic acid export membrane protein
MTGQLTLWLYLPNTVDRVKIRWSDIKRHIVPALSLFLPQIAIQIYAVLNKTMLGYMTNTNEVGYFDNADKIVKMTLAVVTAMGVVMLPRVSNTFAHGERERVKQYLNQSLEFASYLSIPMMFGIAGIAPEFAPWFFSKAFTQTGVLMTIISPIIVLIAWSNVLGVQYLLPTGNNRAFTVSVTVGAVVNFLLNIPLINYYQSTGTAVATVLSELTVTIIQMIYVWKEIDFHKIGKSIWKFMLGGLAIYAMTQIVGRINERDNFTTIFLQFILGSLVYILVLFLVQSDMHRNVCTRVLKLIKRASNTSK